MSCLFCQIAKHEIPAKIVYEDEDLCSFWDIKPQAPVHILIVPKKHISSVTHLEEKDTFLLGKMILTASKIAESESISKSGYRLIFNSGPNSGQIIDHLHLHLIGGRKLSQFFFKNLLDHRRKRRTCNFFKGVSGCFN